MAHFGALQSALPPRQLAAMRPHRLCDVAAPHLRRDVNLLFRSVFAAQDLTRGSETQVKWARQLLESC